jgi:hypothetical protein
LSFNEKGGMDIIPLKNYYPGIAKQKQTGGLMILIILFSPAHHLYLQTLTQYTDWAGK